MNQAATTAVLFFATSFIVALGMNGADLGHLPWYLSRASGLAAFVLLTGSVVFGLLISTKAADGVLQRPLVFAVHQFLSVIVLTTLAVHAGALLFDGFLKFTPASLIIPFTGPYRAFWVGLGVLSGWSTAIVTGSFWMRKRIGQRSWRRLHYLAFGAWVLGLVHGVGAGTDTKLAGVFWVYVLSTAAVAALLTYRIGMAMAPSPKARPVAARAARGEPAR